MDPTRKIAPKLASFGYMEVYGPRTGDHDRDGFHSGDESDEELSRALELSRKEF